MAETISQTKRQLDIIFENARVLISTKEFEQAQKVLEEGLRISESVLGPYNPKPIECLIELGRVAFERQDFRGCLEQYIEARSRLERVLYEDHPLYLKVWWGMGDVYLRQGESTEAGYFFRRALACIEGRSVADPPEYPELLAKLGNVLRSEENFKPCAKIYNKMLLHYEKTRYQDLDRSVNTLARLGTSDIEEYRDERVIPILEEALDVLDGGGHPDDLLKSDILTELGVNLLAAGEVEQATAHWGRALAIKKSLYGDDDPALIPCLRELIGVYLEQAEVDPREVIELYQRVMELVEAEYGGDSFEAAGIYRLGSKVFHSYSMLDQAETLLNQAFGIYHSLLPKNDPTIAAMLQDVAFIASERSDFDKANKALLKSLELRKIAHGPRHHEVARCYLNLARLHDQLDNTAKAVQYFTEICDMAGTTLIENDSMIEESKKRLLELGVIRAEELSCSEEARIESELLDESIEEQKIESSFASSAHEVSEDATNIVSEGIASEVTQEVQIAPRAGGGVPLGSTYNCSAQPPGGDRVVLTQLRDKVEKAGNQAEGKAGGEALTNGITTPSGTYRPAVSGVALGKSQVIRNQNLTAVSEGD